jgi:trehalose utilization protein
MADTTSNAPLRVLVWDENPPHASKAIYPNSLNTTIADALNKLGNGQIVATTANLDQPEQGITEEALANADVLMWWGHARHAEVTDATAERVRQAVHTRGLGFVPLHSGHYSKAYKAVLDATGHLKGGWREIEGFETEEITVCAPRHPIAQGIEDFVLDAEEMYGSPFGAPPFQTLVFQSYFPHGGEYFPCGFALTVGEGIDPEFTSGKGMGANQGEGIGRVFYFRPGHETVPTYHHPVISKSRQRRFVGRTPFVMPRSSTRLPSFNRKVPLRPFKVMRIIARMNIGGPAIHTALLTARLDRRKWQSLLVTGVESPGEGNMLELMGDTLGANTFRPKILPGLGREIAPLNDIKTVRQVVALMKLMRPHIVHTHTAKAGFAGRLAARLARVPVVVHTFHGNVFKGYFSPTKTKLFIAIEKFLARGTDRIIVLSEQQKNEILSLGIGKPEQFRVVPLGLDLAPFLQAEHLRGELRRELGVGDEVPLVGIVARLVPIKAIHLFLEAAKRVLDSQPNALFLVVGDGELRAELEQQARDLGIESSVRFLGFVPTCRAFTPTSIARFCVR